jgi:Putative phage tail protein
MAQLAISVAGAAVGFAVGGPTGAQIGWVAGSLIGSQFIDKPKSQGPRLTDLKVTSAAYGDVIPWVIGHPRVAGQIWWSSDRREVATTTEAGKGGGGATSTSFTYDVDVLIGLTDTVISGVSRIWLNGKLVYTTLGDASEESLAASVNNPNWDSITVYTGDSSQLPDPTYEAALGVGNAPAYRGRGSVMIEGLKLGTSGVIPNLTFEIATSSVQRDSDVLLYVDYRTGSPDDTSCDPFGAPIDTLDSPTWVDDGVQIEQTADPALGVINSYLYRYHPDLDLDALDWTIELLLKEQVVQAGPPPPTGPLVFIISRVDSVANFSTSVQMESANQLIRINHQSEGASVHYYLPGEDSYEHIAIVRTVSSTRYYINGQLVRTAGILQNISFDDVGIHVGGMAGFTPLLKISAVWYKQMVMTRGEKYTDNFVPPFEVASPICAPAAGITNVTLQQTVEALCARSGMSPSEYDATQLAAITKPVRAIAIGQVTSTRSVLEQLQSAYFFDCYATDKLYFVPRGGSVATAVDVEDLATEVDSAEAELLPMRVGSNDEIAAQISLTYANVDEDYNNDTQHSDRLLTGQVNTSVIQLPMAFTSSEAKGIADAVVLDGYASRITGKMSLPVGYADLLPTTVVTTDDEYGNTYRVRLVRRTDEANVLKFEWALDDASALESAGITSTDYTPTVDVFVAGPSIMALLDIPLLQDADNALGHYVAATSVSAQWPGASIQRSVDAVEYIEAASITDRGVIGSASTVLGNFSGGKVFDETNSLMVYVLGGQLSSSTREAMLSSAIVNVLMVGSEIIRFRTATLGSPDTYTLTGLLRGQAGTEWAMSTHVVGETVALLQPQGLRYININLPSIGTERFYKGVTRGRALSTAETESFTCSGISMKPYSPVNIRQSYDTGYVLTWDRRTRLSCGFTGASGVVVPLGETNESYVVTVMDGATVVETQTVSTNTATVGVSGLPDYTGHTVSIAQISELVGAGTAATHTIY